MMKFGYFTLSDNHYVDNRRGANQLVADILDEAIYAEEVGLHSAWIGEHHFSTLGVLSCPDLVLAHVAARTKKIRLAPAVSVLPLHHPIRVAEQWATLDLLSGGRVDFAAGRGYDRREYAPFHVSFEDNQSIFEEGMGIVRRLWESEEPISHHGKHYQFDDVAITETGAAADPRLCRGILAAIDRIGGAARLQFDCCAIRRGIDLWRVAADGGCLSRGLRQARPSAGPAHVQLFSASRRHASGRRGGARAT